MSELLVGTFLYNAYCPTKIVANEDTRNFWDNDGSPLHDTELETGFELVTIISSTAH